MLISIPTSLASMQNIGHTLLNTTMSRARSMMSSAKATILVLPVSNILMSPSMPAQNSIVLIAFPCSTPHSTGSSLCLPVLSVKWSVWELRYVRMKLMRRGWVPMLRSVLMTVSLSTLPYALLKSTLIMYVKPLVISLLSLLSAPSCELCAFRQHWAWWSLSHMFSESLVAASFERSLSIVSSRTMGRTPPLALGIVMSLARHSWGWASCGLFRRRSLIATTVFLTTELSFQVFLRISALRPDIPTPLPPSRLMTAAMTSI